MRICFVPIDNRPVCYNLAKDICAIDRDIELFIPPRELLGDLKKIADTDKILDWLIDLPSCDSIILSLDTIAYGGLIPSRRGKESFEEIKSRIFKLKEILEKKSAKIYAFSSIMRISNNNVNEEEKEYWSNYGKKIFEYSFNLHKNGHADSSEIPSEILEDYLNTRKRNFGVNKIYFEWQKEGFFDTLVFSKDDCAEYGLNVKEAQELETMGGFTKTGADEIPLTLLARSIKKEIKVFVEYTEPDCKDLISNYEDVSIEKSVSGQLELGGFVDVKTVEEADIVLIVNNFREKQGELVMGWTTIGKYKGPFTPPDKPFAVADVRYANGADNDFVEELLQYITPLRHYVPLPPQGGQSFDFCMITEKGNKNVCPPCGENVLKGQGGVQNQNETSSAPLVGEVPEGQRGDWTITSYCKDDSYSHHQNYTKYIKDFSRKMRKEMTKQEVKLWQRIRKEQLGVKFRRQYAIDSKYIADFVCLEKKLVIEIDGGQHCCSEEDEIRTKYLNSSGFNVIRFWNNDIDTNLDGCIQYLEEYIEQNSAPLAGEVGEARRGVNKEPNRDCGICLNAPACGTKCHNQPPFVPSGHFPRKGDKKVLVGLYTSNGGSVSIYPFLGYAGWNTSANTLGSLLAGVKVGYNATDFDENAFKKLQIIRFLDDWAYQANVRGQISTPCDIRELMKPYAEKLSKILDYKIDTENLNYTYPWNRKFEVEITGI